MKQHKERLLHHVHITVFCKPHEDPSAVLRGLDKLSPIPTAELLALDAEQDLEHGGMMHHRGKDIDLMVESTPTDEGQMTIYTLFFRRMQWTSAFAHTLGACLAPYEREEYGNDPALLLDTDGKLSVRFDKQLLMAGKIVLTNDGKCYQAKAAVAAYPKTKQQTIEAVRRMLS